MNKTDDFEAAIRAAFYAPGVYGGAIDLLVDRVTPAILAAHQAELAAARLDEALKYPQPLYEQGFRDGANERDAAWIKAVEELKAEFDMIEINPAGMMFDPHLSSRTKDEIDGARQLNMAKSSAALGVQFKIDRLLAKMQEKE